MTWTLWSFFERLRLSLSTTGLCARCLLIYTNGNSYYFGENVLYVSLTYLELFLCADREDLRWFPQPALIFWISVSLKMALTHPDQRPLVDRDSFSENELISYLVISTFSSVLTNALWTTTTMVWKKHRSGSWAIAFQCFECLLFHSLPRKYRIRFFFERKTLHGIVWLSALSAETPMSWRKADLACKRYNPSVTNQ